MTNIATIFDPITITVFEFKEYGLLGSADYLNNIFGALKLGQRIYSNGNDNDTTYDKTYGKTYNITNDKTNNNILKIHNVSNMIVDNIRFNLRVIDTQNKIFTHNDNDKQIASSLIRGITTDSNLNESENIYADPVNKIQFVILIINATLLFDSELVLSCFGSFICKTKTVLNNNYFTSIFNIANMIMSNYSCSESRRVRFLFTHMDELDPSIKHPENFVRSSMAEHATNFPSYAIYDGDMYFSKDTDHKRLLADILLIHNSEQ